MNNVYYRSCCAALILLKAWHSFQASVCTCAVAIWLNDGEHGLAIWHVRIFLTQRHLRRVAFLHKNCLCASGRLSSGDRSRKSCDCDGPSTRICHSDRSSRRGTFHRRREPGSLRRGSWTCRVCTSRGTRAFPDGPEVLCHLLSCYGQSWIVSKTSW